MPALTHSVLGFLLASGDGTRKPWKGNGLSHKQLQIFISILVTSQVTGQVSIGLSIFNSQANTVVTQWKHRGLLKSRKKEPGTQLDHSPTNAWHRTSQSQGSGVLEPLYKGPQQILVPFIKYNRLGTGVVYEKLASHPSVSPRLHAEHRDQVEFSHSSRERQSLCSVNLFFPLIKKIFIYLF